VAERVLIINTEWPEESCPVQAATLVNYQILLELVSRPSVEVGFLKVCSEKAQASLNDVQSHAKELLESSGVTFLDPVTLPAPPGLRPRLSRLLFPRLVDFYPITADKKAAYAAAQVFDPTSIIIQWCENESHLYSDFPAKKFAYYGNSDIFIEKEWGKYLSKFGESLRSRIIRLLQMKRLEKFHLREMKKWNFFSCVSLNFAKYYQRKFGDKAFYLNNIWVDRYGEDWQEKRDALETAEKIKIVGSIGFLRASANTMGLEILARDLLPELRKTLPKDSFSLDIYGSGQPLAHVKKLLDQPEIIVHGFVEDLDAEIFRSQIFLCVNNASPYKTGHTRYLHAWSLGCCVVAHRDVALSMPELKHNHNALLGENMADIAKLIAKAASDPELRRRLGENGYKTLAREFRVEHVVDTMLEKLTSIEL
jgi:glycosyltransferase involved in cell wall biosynthesis